MKRLLIAGLIGGVVGMIWGMLWWVALPFSNMTIEEPSDIGAVQDVLRETTDGAGTFFFPMVERGASEDEIEKRTEQHLRGPIGQIFLHPGADVMSGSTFLFGFLHFVACTLLMGVILRIATPMLTTFTKRWGFVVLVGSSGVLFSNFAMPIWFMHPWDYWLVMSIYDVLTWAVLGLVLATVLYPRAKTAGAASA